MNYPLTIPKPPRCESLHSPSSDSGDCTSGAASPILFNEKTSSMLRLKEKKSMIKAAKELMGKNGVDPNMYEDWDRILYM